MGSAMFMFMLFIFLGFLALLAINLYLLWSHEKVSRQLRDDHAKLRVLLQAMDSRLKGGAEPRSDDTLALETEQLLRLDFPKTVAPEQKVCDPALDLHFDENDSK